MRSRTLLIVALLTLTACAACSGGDDSTEGADVESTTTVTTTSTAIEAKSAVEVPGPGEPWDLLFISDSEWLSDLVPQRYAELAADALGVEVRLHDAGLAAREAWLVLSQLRDVAYPSLGDVAREAEIIVLWGDPDRLGPNGTDTSINVEFDQCLSDRAPRHPRLPVLPTHQEWKPYRDVLEQIYTEIWSLREGTPTVLIATDLHNPDIARFQRQRGFVGACGALWGSMSDVIRQAAEDNGAAMVSIFELFNGPDGTLDTREQGYTGGPTIWWGLTNEVGSEMVAEALAAVGFEPTTPP